MITVPGGVLCCGNIVQDILVRPVDRVQYDTTTWVDAIELSLGGNGANTAYAVAMLGSTVRLMGFAGADEFGDRLLDQLTSAGVDTSTVVQVNGAPTAVTVALVNSGGARALLHNPGVNLTAFHEPVHFTPELIAGHSHFHLGNPFAIVELRSRAGQMVEAARSAGLTTSLDGGWDSRGQWLEVIDRCLPNLDLLFLNAEESRMLSGHADTIEAGRFFLDRGTRAVVVKLGARGCQVFDHGQSTAVPAFRVEAVDSTGAGDCFAGAFLAGLNHGRNAIEAARLANAAGALSAGRIGSVAGLLPYDATLAWMDHAVTG